jgi:hypothetical protein
MIDNPFSPDATIPALREGLTLLRSQGVPLVDIVHPGGVIQSDDGIAERFERPEVVAAFRIAVRLPRNVGALAEDTLYQRIRAIFAHEYLVGLDPFDVMEALLDVVEAAPDELDPKDILPDVKGRLAQRLAPPEVVVAEEPQGDGPEEPVKDGWLEVPVIDMPEPMKLASKRLADYFSEADRRISGYVLDRQVPERAERGTPELRLEFSDEEDEFTVFLEARIPRRRYLSASEDLGIIYAEKTPPETDKRTKLMRALGAFLKGAPTS